MRVLVLVLALAAGGCARPAAPPPAASPTPTPPPQLAEGSAPTRLPDGRVEYHLIVRSDSGTIFLPIEVVAEGTGSGRASWVRKSGVPYVFDAVADAWIPRAGGEAVDEYFDAVFPASPQELKIPVAYAEATPATETFRLRYRAMTIADLGTHTYVPRAIGDAQSNTAREERHALGERLRGVDVFRWLASGFFLRDPGPVREAVATLPGVT